MSRIHRLFLTVEGENDAYPNYESASVHLTTVDPALLDYANLFITSPLFALNPDGVENVPQLTNGTKISFIMISAKFPIFNDILIQFSKSNEIWFSLGLANLVIIDNSPLYELTKSIISELENKKLIIASETWIVDAGKISNATKPSSKIYSHTSNVVHCGTRISSFLPPVLKFAVSEFIISVDKFLTASKKFTPYYFEQHEKTIRAATDLVSDLSFLYGDADYNPSEALTSNLGVNSVIDLNKGKEDKEHFAELVEELINEWHGKVIQFNSSMSYIYSQTYSGTFPIFDHIGIVRRHSLLGLGSAVGALYELLMQLERALFQLPFENLTDIVYNHRQVQESYLELIIDPTLFNSNLWSEDSAKKQLLSNEILTTNLSEDFFHRLSFFSGRLGFREYELSATAAIQVLVEAHKLPWHVINYTHEIIHNHVRLILNHLLIAIAPKQKNPNEQILKYMEVIEKTLSQDEKPASITYYEYFVTILLKFVINGNIFGSLTAPANAMKIEECQGSVEGKVNYMLPEEKDLQEQMLLYYKDVTEIFVHIVDFSYIYKKQEDIYMASIWSSWSTIPAVINDIKQYILRSLVVLGLNVEGTIDQNFNDVVLKFKRLLEELKSRNYNLIYDRILQTLDDDGELEDMRYRFYNCMIIGDLVNNFFVGKLESLLDNDDKNTMPKDNVDEFGVPKMYYIDKNSFEGQPIKSKVRFLLDQLIQEIYQGKIETDEITERTSAWLLLSLSST